MAFTHADTVRGYRRMKEIGAENKARAEVVAAELLATLSRQPTPIDRVMALTVAAATVKLENQLVLGRDTTTARRALVEALAGSPFAPEQARAHA
jgi:hypothetical protein